MSDVVFITGAGSGIGAATAKCFCKAGYRVVITGRSMDKLQTVADGIKAVGECWPIVLDIQNEDEVLRVVREVYERWGRIDVLINNAGIALGSPKSFFEQSFSDVRTVMNTNIIGPMAVTHAVLTGGMIRNKAGTIVNVSTVTALEAPANGEASYHTSKAALEAFSNVLRLETLGTNIRVLVVRPGYVGGTTNFHSNRLAGSEAAASEVFDGFSPLTEQDVAEAIVFQVQMPARISVKAIDIVPTAQRSLSLTDRSWSDRNDQTPQNP